MFSSKNLPMNFTKTNEHSNVVIFVHNSYVLYPTMLADKSDVLWYI